MKYEYVGSEEKVYYDECGNRRVLQRGSIFEAKRKPNWESIVDRTVSKKRTVEKLKNECHK